MLTTQDVYFTHQVPLTADTVADSGLDFQEVSHFVLFDDVSGVGGVIAICAFPNVGHLFGYSCFVHKGLQYNLRTARDRVKDPWSLTIGPQILNIVDPLARYKLGLEFVPEPRMSYDLTFEAIDAPILVNNQQRPTQVQFNQFGRFHGSLILGSERLQIEAAMGENCRWWSRGPGNLARATCGMQEPPVGFSLWSPLDFGAFRTWVEHIETPDGDTLLHDAHLVRASGDIRAADALIHNLNFVPPAAVVTGGTMDFLANTEPLARVRVDEVVASLSMKGAGYTDDPAFARGVHRGDEYIAGEVWDTRNDGLTDQRGRFVGNFVRVSCDGSQGLGIVETLAGTRHHKYRFETSAI